MFYFVDPIYPEATAQELNFVLEAAEPLSLLTYSFLDGEDLKTIFTSSNHHSLT